MAKTVEAIVNAFLLPGEAILSLIGKVAPETEAIMRIDYGATIYPLVFSLVVWTVALIVGLIIIKMIKNAVWQTAALIRTFHYWVRNQLGNIKTKLLWKYRKFFPHKSDIDAIVGQEEFDRLDIAVMRTLFKQGPAMASSAPDLAEKFSLRPAEVQRRLEKLAENHMVRSVIGSTDGFENYRLSDSGLTFITMMQRRARVSSGVTPVSASGSG